MNNKRLFLIFLMILLGCYNPVLCAEEASQPSNNGTTMETKPDEHLDIIKSALLEGQNEEIRLKAVSVMLFSENPQARKSLIETLSNKENSAARMAICKSLIQSNTTNSAVKNIDDFIQPLLDVLSSENTAEAQLAAETLLIFEYEKIKDLLESLAADQSKPNKTRLNAVHALKLRSDMMAAIKLIELVDDSNRLVGLEAERALQALGVSIGVDPNSRKEEINRIVEQGQEAYLHRRLIYQNVILRERLSQIELWQKRYLSQLERSYKSIEQSSAKGEFLAGYLRDSEPAVRKWALDKAFELRMATGSNLPAELGPIFIDLISDPDRDVRLKTAEILPLALEMNSAQHLLSQLKVEQDEQIKLKLLDALGAACSNALPDPPATIPQEMTDIRKETLQWASKFLSDSDNEKARIGAEVIKKLLKRDGLSAEELDENLGLLVKRYRNENGKTNGNLRGQLINAMAVLCAQDSSCRIRAGEIFKPLFEEALHDENNFVRETAVDGLVYIDKAEALKFLRNDYVNDPSEKIRITIIRIADEFGGKEDLNWLADKIGSNPEGEPAWQAMLNIFKESDAEVFTRWTESLTAQNSRFKLTDDRKIAYLKIAESRVSNGDIINVRKKLAALYYKINDYERAAEKYRSVYDTTKEIELKNEIIPDLVNSLLYINQIKTVVEMIQKQLLEKDIDPNDLIKVAIDKYIDNPGQGTDPNDIYMALKEIKINDPRPVFESWLNEWDARISAAKEPEEKQKAIN